MTILAFTAGAAQMYCGSCLRDNTLAAELRKQGHDIVLMPIYTPTRTDEPNVSDPRVFMNGITVCLEQQSAFFRKTRWLLDGLWDAPWMIRLATKTSIAVDPHVLGAMTVSMLRGEDGYQRKDIGKLTRWLAAEPSPDIVTLPNSLLTGLAKPIREAVRRPLCCTLQGEDHFLSQLPEPYRSQSWELIRANTAHVECYAAVSEFAATTGANASAFRRARSTWFGSASTWKTATRARAIAPADSPLDTWPASRRKRGCTFWPRVTSSCAARWDWRVPLSMPPDILRPSIAGICARSKRSCTTPAWRANSATGASWIARARSNFCASSM